METDKKTNGAFIGLIVIVIILVIGGIYIWMSNRNTAETTQTPETQSGTVTNQDSASLDSIDNDLNKSDTSVDMNNVQ